MKEELLRETKHRRCGPLTPCMRDEILAVQSGREVTSASDSMTTQNVSFRDENAHSLVTMDTVTDSVRGARDAQDAPFADFFLRPIKIASYDWSTSTQLTGNFDPWSAFLSNPRVNNRLCNFLLMRGKLHVKFVVNGNGFHYGRAMACYLPLDNFDNATVTSSLLEGPSVQLSQCPKIFLNPTTNGGGEMVLPFFWHRDYVRLVSNDIEKMGSIYLRDLTGLKHANGATDTCNITVFAWLDDVALSGLTSEDTENLTPQSGTEDEIDEANKTGVISGPATSIAAAASSLGNVPVIGSYARATEKVAKAISAGAKVFGLSRPTTTSYPTPYKPRPISDLAVTTTPDGALKMTVDDKQELSIDPGISGIGREDPLDIVGIASRETWLTNFAWNENVGADTLLWNCRVTPSAYHESVAGTKYLPAMCAASLPFKYWTGSIKYRFQVVCSAYHKGRLRIVFDPWVLGLTPEYNVNYVKVVDIAECSDFTITVPLTQCTTFLETLDPGLISHTEIYSTTRYSLQEDNYCNGVIGVYVVNDLTTPNSTVNNDIKVNVFVSAGDDFEVAVPTDGFQRLVFKPQSGLETDAINANGLDTPEDQAEECKLGAITSNTTEIGHVYFGERIKSFRPLLKRYTLHETVSPLASTNPRMLLRRAFFPYYRGNIANAFHTTSVATNYNFVNTLLLHYVTMMFSGMRGSIRYKILPFSTQTSTDYTAFIERDMASRATVMWETDHMTTATFSNDSEAADSTVTHLTKDVFPDFKSPQPFANGGVYANGQLNPHVEYEVPFYSMDRFIPGKKLDYTGALSSTTNPFSIYRALLCNNESGPSNTYSIYTAAGEDFQVYFFTGMPPVYWESVPPPPAT